MAKVDVAKIEGYEGMSVEEKLAALENYEFEEKTSGDVEHLKELLSKSNSEAANYKKQLRERQSDEEKRAAAEAEAKEAMQKELEELRREKVFGAHKASLLELGYDGASAEDSAKALMEGDFTTFFANQKKFVEAQRRDAESAALDKQPGLSAGAPITSKDVVDPIEVAIRRGAGLPT